MRNIKLKLAMVLLGAMASCNKMEVATPDFEVTVNTNTFRVGEPVTFNFNGNAQNITFYSGEDFAKYADRGKSTLDKAVPKLEFSSATAGGLRANSLKLMYTISTEVPTVSNINTLNWVDITDRFALATTTAAIPTGLVDLSDLVALKAPLRFAFKYESALSSTLAHPIWSIRSFNLNSTYSDGTIVPIATLATPWTVLDVKNTAATWVVSSTQLREDGGARNTADQEDWLVTNPFNLDISRSFFNVGTAVKSINDKLAPFTYTFEKPGTYVVTFVAFNHTIEEEKSIVKELTITIAP